VYEGQFENGRRKGNGILYTPDCTQRGVFDNYFQCGEILYTNNNVYKGEMANNAYNGKGEFFNASAGTLLRGTFRNGKLEGEGEVLQGGRTVYKGNFAEGLKHGQGTYYLNDKDYYKGGYYKGKKNGFGELVSGNTMYRGKFVNGEMNGEMEVSEVGNPTRKNRVVYENGRVLNEEEQSEMMTEKDGMPM
jgi:hypothetical protein